MKKEGLLVIFLIALMINSVIAVEVVQVQQTPPPKETHWYDLFLSPAFWLIFIGFILFCLFLVGLFFFVRWLIKFIKRRNDVFYRMRTERIGLAKIQRSYPSKHWFKVDKNTPIRLVKKIDGKIKVGNIVAFHRGDYTTSEGNLVIALNVIGDKHWFIYPKTSLLVIPDREEIVFSVKDPSTGKSKTITLDGLPRAKDIVQFNEGEILLHAESISQVGYFLIPVLKTSDGKVLDLSLPIYQTFKEVLINEYLYEQSTEFVSVSKKTMDMNPHIRAETKLRDPNSSVDVPNHQ